MKNDFIRLIDEICFNKNQLYNLISDDLNIEDARWHTGEFPNPYISDIYYDDGSWGVECVDMIDDSVLYFLDCGNSENREYVQIDIPSFDNTYSRIVGHKFEYYRNEDSQWLILNIDKKIL